MINELQINETLHLKYGEIESSIFCDISPDCPDFVEYYINFGGYDLLPGVNKKYGDFHYCINGKIENVPFSKVMNAWLFIAKKLRGVAHNQASIKKAMDEWYSTLPNDKTGDGK